MREISGPVVLEETEREQIVRALEQANWVISGPAGAASYSPSVSPLDTDSDAITHSVEVAASTLDEAASGWLSFGAAN
jgi:hypothetical protein